MDPKKDTKKQVEKALSPEEQTIVSDIQSMLGELLSMNQAAPVEAPVVDEVEMAENGNGEKPEEKIENVPEEKPVEKELVQTPGDNKDTASDKTEQRMDEQLTEPTEENVSEVAKALVAALEAVGKKDVQKAQNPVIRIMEDTTKVIKQLQENQNEQSNVLASVLEGLGVTEQMKIAKSEAAPKNPITAVDNNATIKFLTDLANTVNKSQNKEEDKHLSQNGKVQKTLTDGNVMKALFTAQSNINKKQGGE